MKSLSDIFDIVNKAIDDAFIHEKYCLNFYDYLQSQKYKRIEIINFISSSLGQSLFDQIEELDVYLNGGEQATFLNEVYDWMGKPRAERVRNYLNKILEDAKRYEQFKKPGRKPKATANK